ncbi:thioredoxin domain-containing protein [Pelagibaculum spongiae]|uniref:Thioredoxin-like fold domain-containing protein n=1 Tax=Pelagibaculum spongiae TaxID=2080658 RepID=A0A2V1GP94_9GAMM|nr:hypothetical protein DC094_19630 [Pelagibaculum spongiae]
MHQIFTCIQSYLIYGNPSAKITLQEYGDIECPYCRKMHSVIKQVINHSQGVINWEFPIP